jgi:hypothetical protein
MKDFRRFFAAAALTLALTFSTLAGDIQSPGILTQPPPATGPMDTPKITDVSCSSDISYPGDVSLDPLTEVALSMLQSVLSIL